MVWVTNWPPARGEVGVLAALHRGHVDPGVGHLVTRERVTDAGVSKPDSVDLSLVWQLVIIAGVRMDENLDGPGGTIGVSARVTTMVVVVLTKLGGQPVDTPGQKKLASVEETFSNQHAANGDAETLCEGTTCNQQSLRS